jgi:hypothetical protein
MLKYEATAEVNDIIKAFDWEPYPSRDDSFLIGKVISKGPCSRREDGMDIYICDGYTVEVTNDSDTDEGFTRIGSTVYVPFEAFHDFEGRVKLLGRKIQ